MMRQGPIPLTVHALAEPFLAALLIAAPWIFGFDDVGSATAISIVAGIAVLLVGMSTDWKIAMVRKIPLVAHMALDFGLGIFLVAAPFLFGFSDESGALPFFLVIGILLLLSALGTRWTRDSPVASPPRSRSSRATRA
jgi:predicted lysophospholipase L1 biosynthesis ABC-type transport system permease subunit